MNLTDSQFYCVPPHLTISSTRFRTVSVPQVLKALSCLSLSTENEHTHRFPCMTSAIETVCYAILASFTRLSPPKLPRGRPQAVER